MKNGEIVIKSPNFLRIDGFFVWYCNCLVSVWVDFDPLLDTHQEIDDLAWNIVGKSNNI
jgi:hypothetical protein